MKYTYSVFTVRKITLQLRRGAVIDIWLQWQGDQRNTHQIAIEAD